MPVSAVWRASVVVTSVARVPTISVFYGIVIRMYYDDHSPPHFHAIASGRQARISIATCEPIGGELSPRQARRVREWTQLRRSELEANWSRARQGLSLREVEPLP